ncbi:hypothetical protein ACP70R_006479 [Stipagrostis hirtigluma subsp. patula]
MVNGLEDAVGNADNDIVEQEENTGMVKKPKKRLISTVWDDFIPTSINMKVERAECKHCHQVFSCSGATGTTNLQNHQSKCITGTQKRPKQHKHTSLPSTQKSTGCTTTDGSDLKQKTLPLLSSNQEKGLDTTDAMPEQELALPNSPTDMNRKNQDNQNGSQYHKELAAPKQKDHALPVISIDKNAKNQEVGQHVSPELVRILIMHGQAPRIVEQEEFRKLVAYLNPVVKMPSNSDLIRKPWDLFQQEKSKLKEKLTALCCRVCLSTYLWHYDPLLAFLCLTVHYIDDEWEKQQKIIRFCSVNPTAKELSFIILEAIGEWGLDGKVFSIILDDAFTDD